MLNARLVLLAPLLWATAPVLGAATEQTLTLADKTQVSVLVHPAKGEALILWLPSGHNLGAHEAHLAQQAAAAGIEFWRPDVLNARFLPPLESSLEALPASDIAELIAAAHRQTGKRIYLAALARGARLALAGADAFLARQPNSRALAGAILLHPALYAGPPEPGGEADYDPVVARTRVPVFIIQPENSPWRWRIERTVTELERSGAKVTLNLWRDVRDRFYFRPDATEVEQAAAERLTHEFVRAIEVLAAAPLAPPRAAPTTQRPAARGKVHELRPYKGVDTVAPALKLRTLDGAPFDLTDLRGRVVLVNFWASWCPPCVHEMPSMEQLQARFKDRPFTVLAVNMGEDEATIRAFLARVPVKFQVALDRDGAALKRWKVYVFPTSYIVGKDGTLRFAVVGDLDWDAPEVVTALEALL